MSWYRAGEIAGSAGNAVITGVNTNWIDNKQAVGAGQALIISVGDATQIYEIEQVESATQIRLTSPLKQDYSGEYAILTFYVDSVPDFARRLSTLIGYFTTQLAGLQDLVTSDSDVTFIKPDGTSVIIPSIHALTKWVDEYKKWFDGARDDIDNVAGNANEAKAARDEAVQARLEAIAAATGSEKYKEQAKDYAAQAAVSEQSASASETAAASALAGAISAKDNAKVSMEGAKVARDRAEAAAQKAKDIAEAADIDKVMEVMSDKMDKTGGTFTGPVTLVGDATNPLEPTTKQQVESEIQAITENVTNAVSSIGTQVNGIANSVNNIDGRVTTLEAGADALLGKNNTWTATNKFIGGLSVAAPAGSSEGGQIDLDDKDGGRAYFIDIDADGNFRVVRSGNNSGITTNVMFQLMRTTNDAWIRSTLNVEGGIKATGSIHAGNAVMGTDGNIVGSIWNGGSLASHLGTVGGIKNVARGANAVITWGYISGVKYQDTHVPAGCYISGMQVKRSSGTASSGPIDVINALFYRPVMIQNSAGAWVQIGDIA
ncbi:hypothetical protein ACS780_21415 [Yersinia enterocolitica]|uniref:hypothetical protein n=1 Tax=Yersinia enterocolitica TaxID=630 RepID=UPI003F46AAA2